MARVLLSLEANAGRAPLVVNASAGKATNLNADNLDGKVSTAYLGKTEKAADAAHANSAGDANTLDGQDSTAFLGANQQATDADKLDNKDSADFIERNPSVAQNGSINIDGTLQTSGMVRTGSEMGTSQIPNREGLVVRRINSTFPSAGQVVARTDQLRLERDGTDGGLRIAWDANVVSNNTVNCMGINGAGGAINHHSQPVTSTAAGTVQVFTDAQNVVYATCSFGDSFNARDVTQVTMQRAPGDNFWVGTVISTYNQ
jgi:hypothetical protein